MKYVAPRWGDLRISAILPTQVKAWVRQLSDGTAMTNTSNGQPIPAELARPRSATHVGRALTVLTGILDDAVADGRLAKNPARGITNLPRKIPKRERRYLGHAEVYALVQALDGQPERQTLVQVLAYTGLRWGEATGLRVRDANMLRRRLEVRRNAVNVGGTIIVGTPKTHEARSVPFPEFLAMPLARQCENKGPDDLLFPGADGGHLRAPNTTTGSQSWWLTALRVAELDRLTLHDLRHTAASLAISAGANVKAVQRMLGHSSAAMTLDTYADLFEDDLDAVAERLNEHALLAGTGFH